mmetsp:Transcript_36940/g.85203  ORF Transcript_36940/g.85203 Transcript_36940/m.85203 type:complete len:125 (-) Transcript_36940:87-461(-)
MLAAMVAVAVQAASVGSLAQTLQRSGSRDPVAGVSADVELWAAGLRSCPRVSRSFPAAYWEAAAKAAAVAAEVVGRAVNGALLASAVAAPAAAACNGVAVHSANAAAAPPLLFVGPRVAVGSEP